MRLGIVFAIATTHLLAQINTASLTGLVQDPSQSAVANAKVTITQKETGVQRTVMTDQSGSYFFPVLPIGGYDITVEVSGFQRAAAAITLETGQKGRQDFTMAVGALETQVTVVAAAPQLSPQDASIGSVVDASTISRFPLLGRSWDDLMAVVPGMQGNRYSDQGGGTSFGRQGGFNVHGIRSLQNNFTLDGIDNNSISENVQELTTQVVRPSIDAIQEFKITTNPYSAEYGRSPGAAISVTTKTGTNEYHGLAFEYLRNRVLDANDFFSNRAGLVKPQNIQNQFGGNLGGPIKKEKLFAFFDYEGTRIRRGVSRVTTVPLANERAGNFTTAASGAARVSYPAIYDPATGQPFANNSIPSDRIDPVAQKLLALFPQPTDATRQTNNFTRNAGLLDDTNRYTMRADWAATDHDTVFVRYSFSMRDRFIPGNFGGIADGTSSSALGRQNLAAHAVALGWTRVLTATLLNEFRAGFLRDNSFAAQDPFGLNHAADYVPGVPANPAVDGGVPRTTFTGFDSFVGSPDFLPKFQVPKQWQFVDNISLTRGRHAIKFGADIRMPLRNNYMDVPATRGQLNFDRIFTCQRSGSGCVAGTGLSYADGLLGYVQQAALTNVYFVDQRLQMWALFAQDDFKISRRLTMNLGLRYDFSSPAIEGKNHLANFSPAGSGSLVLAVNGSLKDRALVNIDRNNVAPRIGLAYQLTSKTVVRAGYGVFYSLFDRIGSEDQLALNPPYLVNNNISLGATAAAPLFLLRNGFPANYLDPNAPGLLSRVRVRAANPDAPQAYTQQWSFGMQRLLPGNWFLEANYVGTKTTHLNTLRNFNQPLSVNGVVNPGLLPYPNFGQIEYRDPLGNSIYDGLDVILERRLAAGLTLRAAYTWSKSIDNTGEHLATTQSFSQNGRDFHSWRGPSDFDVPQRFVLSYVYELPFPKGKGAASYVLGGWRLVGGLAFASGRPFTPTANSNNSSIDRGLQSGLPNAIGAPFVPENIDCWYYSSRNANCRRLFPNATDFLTIPAAGVFGSVGRNSLRAQGTRIADIALHKDFPFGEKRALQFRWEMYNVANTTHFGYPNRDASGGSGASVTQLAIDPRLMQAALRLNF
ncbi:MAG: TonB-dependent receptor [Terriglobia bacterium]|nr:MAG: TonB-dependent receptor [Terriglobia bacterium]